MLFLLSLITLTFSRHVHQVDAKITQGVNLMCMKLMESARIGELPKGKVGPLAQLVEQRTFNPWVDGSSPSGPTDFTFVPKQQHVSGKRRNPWQILHIKSESLLHYVL